MGLDFNKPTTTATPATASIPTAKEEIIVSTIEVNNLDTIVSFGAEVAEEISKASDVVLNSMNMSQLDDTSVMLTTLAKIMDQN